MYNLNRFLVVSLSFLILSSLIVIITTPATAQAVSKPSVPEFTLQFVDNSYDVSPTFSKDPFTGETVMIKEGYHVDNRTVEVRIKNPAVTFYTDSQGNYVFLCYDIRWKGHFDDYWYEYSNSRDYTYRDVDCEYNSDGSWRANLPYTTVTYVIGTNRDSGKFVLGYEGLSSLGDVSDGGQIDFQVQAFIGYYTRVEGSPDVFTHKPTEQLIFSGESSGWSMTKTVTIGASGNGTQNLPSSDQKPNVPTDQSGDQNKGIIAGLSLMESSLIIAVVVLLILVIIVTLVYSRKKVVDNNIN